MSLKYIVEYELYKGKVFEAGGESIFTNFLRTLLCTDDIAHSKTDLRQSLDLQQKYDAIICMEVFEHINDINLYHNFQFEGIKRMLGSFWKILNPNGKIFITTPNITGIVSIYRILQGKHPMMHTVHVREYTPDELRIITTSLGFEIDLLTTEYIFKGYMVEPAHNALKLAHMPETLRGDDIVLILRKPDGVSFNDDINLAALLA